jgi:tetratricopeptide (TPR) repeat protein
LRVILISFCLATLCLQVARRTEWYRDWLLHRLVTGSEQQALRAAGELAVLQAQRQLLAALKAHSAHAREYGRRALEYLWFTAAGSEAYQQLLAAEQAAEREDYHTALTLLNQILEQHPNFAEAWNRRAAVHWQLGLIARATADSKRALELNPNHYGAWQGLGLCYLDQGNVAEAIRCLRAALALIPYDEATRASLRRCEQLLRDFPTSTRSIPTRDKI